MKINKQLNKDRFNFKFPVEHFEKGKNNKGQDVVWTEGLASSSKVIDVDGDQMQPDGFDYTYFLSNGYFNWEHGAGKTSKSILGHPTECRIVADGNDFDFFVKGFLYPSEETKAIVELANNLEKYADNRRVQFSIEGRKLATDPQNQKG